MITLIKGTEAACGTDAAGASTFGSATAVRLVNTTATARLVTVIDEVGGSTTIGTFTLLGNTREVVEKKSTEAIFAAHASVLGAKVGYTKKMKLNTEEISQVQFVTEKYKGKKRLCIEGVFLQGGIKNRNGRMYPVDILEREVNRYNKTFVREGRALGELGHPEGPTVNLDRVSHKITSLVREGNNFRGKATLLSTPMGKIASSLLDEGVKLGVSSRGVGSRIESNNGCKMVGEDFQLATAADIVADPSAPDAFVNGIMEGKEWVWEGGNLREQLAEKTQKTINTLVDQKRLEEKKLSLFQDFLNNL